MIGGERGNVEHPRNLWELGLPAMTMFQALDFLQVYISISLMMAEIGSALTAGHYEKPKVTKGFNPLHSVPR